MRNALVYATWKAFCLGFDLFPFPGVLAFKRELQGAAAWGGLDLL